MGCVVNFSLCTFLSITISLFSTFIPSICIYIHTKSQPYMMLLDLVPHNLFLIINLDSGTNITLPSLCSFPIAQIFTKLLGWTKLKSDSLNGVHCRHFFVVWNHLLLLLVLWRYMLSEMCQSTLSLTYTDIYLSNINLSCVCLCVCVYLTFLLPR